ncbi:MAG: alpha-glucosidase/alpha-galactosidase [Defluviitaleaceae bacterium]|nr:alpha-glucosidase/alpha-galactosidase [Defluviitaleaceae bacterium]MCL2837202.1 alpha-glucosidase/alpha-galactosidase [Defluviitaleaceae bacterium]
MGKKFTFIGAGSLGFTTALARDILSFEAFRDCEIHLMDIHEGRLASVAKVIEKLIAAGKYAATVHSTTDRKKALKGADGVLITILQGGVDVWRHDIEIPKKYGVDINVGDTRGPSGVMRFLRTAPVMLDIIRDVEALCPDAVVLNYTNPMGMLCSYLQRMSKVNITGLCHSVQGTADMLAGWIGAKPDEVAYTCSGINHTAFYLDFRWNGKDAYPLIKDKVMNDPAVANAEPVRNEMFLQLGYYPTESSGHNSEYLPWFRKRPDLIEKYCTHGTNWNPGVHAYILNEYLKAEATWEERFKEHEENEDVNLERGGEYASNIFNALFGDGKPFVFNGNQLNNGLISNLPPMACVETPVLASPAGLQRFNVGPLPDNLAILVDLSARIEEMAVNAAITGEPWKVLQANLFDPLTASVLSMAEIREMTQEMLTKNEAFLGYFKSVKI